MDADQAGGERARAAAAQSGAERGGATGAEVGRVLGAALGSAALRTTEGAAVARAAAREGADAAGRAAQTGVTVVRTGADRVTDTGVGGALAGVRTRVATLTQVLEGVVEDARDSGADVAQRLTGRRKPRSRWPWAAGAAGLGAAAGIAVVVIRRRVVGEDAPDAQEPGELRAVVDLGVRPDPPGL